MCNETVTISAPLGDTTTVKPDSPILSVTDSRMDDPKNQRRRKVLAIYGKYFPMSAGAADAMAKGAMPPYNQGDSRDRAGNYKPMVGGADGQDSCAPINAYLMNLLGARGRGEFGGIWGFGIEWGAFDEVNFKPKRSKRQDGFVPYAPGLLPSVGDTFILYRGTMAHHCGVVCQASADSTVFWITADGGQPDRATPLLQRADGTWGRAYDSSDRDPYTPPGFSSHQGAYLVPRTIDCANPKSPVIANFFTGKVKNDVLYGWRNVTDDNVKFDNEAFDDMTGSQADYDNFKARIIALNQAAIDERKQRPYSPMFI